jgi:hypothetical protein
VLSVASGRGEYLPRGTLAELEGVDYLALHGALDAQSTSFGGQSQFSRVRPANFKAAVLVAGANHDQFNTAWGRVDVPDFWGWSLDTREVLPGEAQRQVASVYFSAFVETVLHGRRGYQPMFADARLAAAWLPRTYVTSRYADVRDERIADFEDDADVTTAPGVRVRGEHLERWGEVWVPLKKGGFDTHALAVQWARPDARLIIELDAPRSGGALVMSLGAGDDVREPLDFELVLTDADGATVRRAVSDDQLLYPQLEARTRLPFLEHRPTREPNLRRYTFPLTSSVKRIELAFTRTPRGSLYLDDVGVSP